MKLPILAVFLMAANFSLAQIKNGSFENWDTTYTAPYSADLDTTFGVAGATGGALKSWIPESQGGYGLSRSVDSQSGNYSMLLHNWYGYFNESIRYRDTLSSRPQFLQGYFKYITGAANGLAQGNVRVALTRISGSSTDTIATGTFLFDSVTVFTPFQLELDYRSSAVPDHIDIRFTNSDRQCTQGNTCHLLFLDNLSLSGTVTGTGAFSTSPNRLQFFPNPLASYAIMHSGTLLKDAVLIMYDVTGRRVMERNNLQGKEITIQRSNLPAGLYSIRIYQNGELAASEKLLIAD